MSGSNQRTGVVQHYRTTTPDDPPPPGLLADGEVSLEQSDPMRLWMGVPMSIDPTGRRLLLDASLFSGGPFLPLTGGILTGPLTLAADPTTALEAATKEYVDAQVARYLPLTGGVLTGPLTLSGNATANLQAVPLQQLNSAITSALGAYLPLAGGTMTGSLVLAAEPIAPMEAATKSYVDAQVSGDYLPLSGGTLTGSLFVEAPLIEIDSPAGQWASLKLSHPAGQGSQIVGAVGGSDRWTIEIGTATAESGSNAGSDFSISRFDDTGAYLGTAFQINRASGTVTTGGVLYAANQLVVQGTGGNTRWDLYESDGPADQKYTDFYTDPSGNFGIQFVNDAFNAGDGFLSATRSGYTVATLTLAAPAINLNGGVTLNGGETITGALQVNGAITTSGSLSVNENIWANTYISTNGYLSVTGVIYGNTIFPAYNAAPEFYLGVSGTLRLINWQANYYDCWDATQGNRSWVSNNTAIMTLDNVGNFWTNGSYNCAGNLTVGATTQLNGNLMVANGIMYVANNYAYYFARTGTGWNFVENNNAIATLSFGGNFTVQQALACQSTGVVYQNLQANGFNFRWDGTTMFIRVDNAVEWAIQPQSDERLKDDIQPSTFDCLAAIVAMPLFQFRWKTFDSGVPDLQEAKVPADAPLVPVGFVAQRQYEVFPDAVIPGSQQGRSAENATTMWQMNANTIMAALCGAVQQLVRRIEALEGAPA
jgi:hypothetical protein